MRSKFGTYQSVPIKKSVDKISDLKPTMVVKNKSGSDGYIITANYGDYAIGVKTIHISNPNEWEIINE